MFRLALGFFITVGACGGMELTTLSPMGAFLSALAGVGLLIWTIADGTVSRLQRRI